jgi:hypothetical protein
MLKPTDVDNGVFRAVLAREAGMHDDMISGRDNPLHIERFVGLAFRALLHRKQQRLPVTRKAWVVVSEVVADELVISRLNLALGGHA